MSGQAVENDHISRLHRDLLTVLVEDTRLTATDERDLRRALAVLDRLGGER